MSKLGKDQRGGTAVEYGLIAALIVIATMTAIQYIGKSAPKDKGAEPVDTSVPSGD